jgi:hypothetical protein
MAPAVSFWKLNRFGTVRKVIASGGTVRTEPVAMLYEYVGYVKSETKPGVVYHVVVRIKVDPAGKAELVGYTCECEGFVYHRLCKHVKALYNVAIKDALGRVAAHAEQAREADQMREQAERQTYSLEL